VNGGSAAGGTQPLGVSTVASREDLRRALHAISALLGPAALALPGSSGSYALAGLVALALGLEIARHASPFVGRLVAAAGRTLFRPQEAHGVSGATSLAVGYFVAWLLFDHRLAAAAIVVAGLADPAAALVGRRLGRGSGKSVAGSTACACTAAAALLASGFVPLTALLGGVAAATAERVRWRGADNVLVPLLVGGVLTLLHV